MVEVFKTNITEPAIADLVVAQIQQTFSAYQANFDLDDCDNILRVECKSGRIEAGSVMELVKSYGFYLEVLEEDDQHAMLQEKLIVSFPCAISSGNH